MPGKKISAQSKSFVILVVIAIVGIYVCLFVLRYLNGNGINPYWRHSLSAGGYRVIAYRQPATAAMSAAAPAAVDTSSWKTYSNTQYHLSFLYNPSWKVLAPKNQNGFEVLQVDPGARFYNIKIYISQSQFYAVSGLPYQTEMVDGVAVMNIENLLFAAQNNGYYYTFDIGYSLSLKPQFDALVQSVKFE